MVSCGNENQVNTNGFTPQQGAEIFNSVQNTGTLTYLSALIQQTQCPSGQRLPEVRFRTNSYNVIGDRLVANYSPGSHPGQVAANYAGITPQGDILFVQKVTNGMNVLGFNVSVSFALSQMYYALDVLLPTFILAKELRSTIIKTAHMDQL